MKYSVDLKLEDLGAVSETTWKLCDEDPETGLKLVHYTEASDRTHWGYLRGIIFDSIGRPVVHTTEYCDVIVADKISVENGELVCYDFQTDSVKRIKHDRIWRGEEGVVLRAFKYRGKVYISSFHSLDCGKSYWASEKSFLDHFKRVVPYPEELFDPSFEDSDFVYMFVLRGPNTSACAKESVIYDKVFLSEVIRIRETGQTISPIAAKIPKTVEFTIEQANAHLKYGYLVDQIRMEAENGETLPVDLTNKEWYPFCNHDDYRRGFGEFIAVAEGRRTWKIQSRAYNWRFMIQGNSQRLETRLFRMIDDSLVKYMTDQDFEKKYVLFKPYDEDGMHYLEDHLVAFNVHEDRVDLNNSNVRLEIIMLNLIFASTICKQKEAYDAYLSILKKRSQLVDKFVQMVKADWKRPEEQSKVIQSTARIINLVVQYTDMSRAQKGTDEYWIQLKKNMTQTLCRERGESLRKLCEFYGFSRPSSPQNRPRYPGPFVAQPSEFKEPLANLTHEQVYSSLV